MSEHEPLTEAEILERLRLDGRPGPAARISNARAQAMIEAALEAGLPALEEPEHKPWVARVLDLPPFVRALAAAAAVLLVLAGGAAAAKLVQVAFFAPVETVEAAPKLVAPAVKKSTAPKKAERAPAADDEMMVFDGTELDGLPEPKPERSARGDSAAQEDLLQQANRARAAGRFREAAQTYALVYERNPSSLPAYVAAIAAGSIELEHLARPEQAARLFRRALRGRPHGSLDLEARQGLALALRDLGATREEISVLRALIDAHPSRPAATRARARLYELGASAAPSDERAGKNDAP